MISLILNIIIIFCCVIVFTIFSFTNILQFQLNEYLFIRFKGYIKEVGILKILFPMRIRFPAKSIRNLLITLVVFILVLIYYSLLLYIFSNSHNEFLILLLISLGYLVSKLGVVIGVLVTTPLASLVRYRLIWIANRQLKQSNVQIIGVTGSYGKSSVKEFLHRILSTKYLTGKTRGNHNTDVGIAIEIGLQVTRDTKYFVAEMGAYTKGDIKKLCQMYKPSVGIISGIGNQHLSLFGSQTNLIQTKFEMVNGVDGVCYVNIDWEGSENIVQTYKKFESLDRSNQDLKKRIITYGSSISSDVALTDVCFKDEFIYFTLKDSVNSTNDQFRTKLIGRHNLVNLIPAILLSKQLNVDIEEIKNVVENIKPILGKLSIHHSNQGFSILNDSYNSNLNGFISALETFKDIGKGSKLYVSSLGIFELGDQKMPSYIKIINKLRELEIILLTTDPLFKEVINLNTSNHNQSDMDNLVVIFNNEKEIFEYIKDKAKEHKSMLLLEGRHSSYFTSGLGIKKAY